MTIEILQALGAEDESAALRLVAQTNEFVEDLRKLTGKESFGTIAARIREIVSLARDVEDESGKPAAEAIGVILAWKASHEALPAVQQELEAQRESLRAQEVAGLIEQGKKDGKLTQATAEFWKTRGAAELKAFLDVAPRVIPAEIKQPVPLNAERGAAATADGQKYEDMKPMQRASLKKSDPELYNALRSDWEQRGKPAGVLAA